MKAIRSEIITVQKYFDADFYNSTYPDVQKSGVDPLEHYMDYGWKEGRNPNKSFSTTYYIQTHLANNDGSVNPLLHYAQTGFGLGLSTEKIYEDDAEAELLRPFFNEAYYLFWNHDVRNADLDPLNHYIRHGWLEGRNPSPEFDTYFYMRAYSDVSESGMIPLKHYILIGRQEGRKCRMSRPYLSIAEGIDRYSTANIFARFQDESFPVSFDTTKKLIVVVVPEHSVMSGGIFSMFSIAHHLKYLKNRHGFDVIVMTNPNETGITYCRQRNFTNSIDVFRFEQIVYCQSVDELYIMIPEYATKGFLDRCSASTIKYLCSRPRFFINILNQNIKLMPEPHDFFDLRRICDGLTQSVAHHAYYTQDVADKYDLKTLLLPAFTDLSSYKPTTYRNKENLIIYSYDPSSIKQLCLQKIAQRFPNYKLVEIFNISFDHYMDLATRCRFSISFGEGYDGYIAQPIHQGGIGFAVYSDDYFPSADYLQFPNIFASDEDMIDNICEIIDSFEKDPDLYNRVNADLNRAHDKLYNFDEYLLNIEKLSLREFGISPSV